MTSPTFAIYMARHGETAWSISHKHTGLTDIPLTAQGEANARALGRRIQVEPFAQVFCSPLQRARRTCELAGFAAAVAVDRDLVEWNYGAYEGLTTEEIRQRRPDWDLFRDGCPNGESVADIAARADRMVARLRSLDGNTLLFSHGHFLRVLTARWLGLVATCGRCFMLDAAALSILGYEHGKRDPVIRLWNDVSRSPGPG
jgi:probable phosphoglycerate mutase